MKKLPLLILLFFVTISQLYSQVVSSTPALPTATDEVTIIFDATQGSGGLAGYTGDVYAHTGVITDQSSSGSDWKYVIAGWSENTAKAKMTPLGNDKYQLVITPSITGFYGVSAGETIQQMAFVFRNSDGSKVGKTASGEDIFVEVYEGGLNVKINSPTEQPFFVDAGEAITVTAEATGSTSLKLYIDDVEVKSVSSATLEHTFNAEASGKHVVKAVAGDGTTTKEATIYYLVRTSSVLESLPEGLVDGINYIDNQTVTLVLRAPYKNSLYVLGDFNDWQTSPEYQMKRTTADANDIETRYWLTISGLTAQEEYAFQYLIDEELKIADPYADKILDPWNDEYIESNTYPNLKTYPEGKTDGIVSVFQTAQTAFNWQVNNFTAPDEEDLIIYELHIRDFLQSANYQTLTDTIGYLKTLGVNAIELMPINEFEGNDSWGYNPSFYFAADKAYGDKNSLKSFIDACHTQGIAVIIDMVMNHSYGQSPFLRLYFDASAGNYGQPSAQNLWYNQTSPNTTYSWGYDFNHESQATKDLLDRINAYWLSDYKVDGFRFDFTKGFTNTSGDGWAYDAARISILKRMYLKIREVNPKAYVILEHLADNSEEKELANFGMLLWGNMNHDYAEAAMGYSSNLSGTSYKNRAWNDPQLVSYMESHDEERLMYKNLEYGNSNAYYNIKELHTALRRIEQNAAFFFSFPGPKMIWQFGELGYDYSIDYNDRVGRKPVKWDYFDEPNRKRLYEVFAALTKLRSENEAFSTTDFSISVATGVKRINLNHSSMNVTVIGNFGIESATIDPNFQETGTWYDYFTGEAIQVSDANTPIWLTAGEYHIYTTVQLTVPDVSTSVDDFTEASTEKAILVYPNPSNNRFNILINSKLSTNSQLVIYNIFGQKVKSFATTKSASANYQVEWDARNDAGNRVSAGIYFLKIEGNNQSEFVKLIVN